MTCIYISNDAPNAETPAGQVRLKQSEIHILYRLRHFENLLSQTTQRVNLFRVSPSNNIPSEQGAVGLVFPQPEQ